MIKFNFGILKKFVKIIMLKNLSELKQCCKEEWAEIPPQWHEKLISHTGYNYFNLLLLLLSHAIVIHAECGLGFCCWNNQDLPWKRCCFVDSTGALKPVFKSESVWSLCKTWAFIIRRGGVFYFNLLISVGQLYCNINLLWVLWFNTVKWRWRWWVKVILITNISGFKLVF